MQRGDIVKSTAGHDSGRIYVILEITGEFALLTDGEYRKLENPKKKRLKHIKFVMEGVITQKPKITDIKRLVKDASKIVANKNTIS